METGQIWFKDKRRISSFLSDHSPPPQLGVSVDHDRHLQSAGKMQVDRPSLLSSHSEPESAPLMYITHKLTSESSLRLPLALPHSSAPTQSMQCTVSGPTPSLKYLPCSLYSPHPGPATDALLPQANNSDTYGTGLSLHGHTYKFSVTFRGPLCKAT